MPADFLSRATDAAPGDFDNQRPWELCTTIAGAQVKPLEHYIQLLAKVAGRDGNLLLNMALELDTPAAAILPVRVAD